MVKSPVVFFQEVRTELGKVVWPTREETIRLTVVVVVVSLVIGLFIGGLDFSLTNIVQLLVKR